MSVVVEGIAISWLWDIFGGARTGTTNGSSSSGSVNGSNYEQCLAEVGSTACAITVNTCACDSNDSSEWATQVTYDVFAPNCLTETAAGGSFDCADRSDTQMTISKATTSNRASRGAVIRYPFVAERHASPGTRERFSTSKPPDSRTPVHAIVRRIIPRVEKSQTPGILRSVSQAAQIGNQQVRQRSRFGYRHW